MTKKSENLPARKACETFKLIPHEKYLDVYFSGEIEVDCEFLCFEENYIPVANLIPHDWIVVDLGCYIAAQSYWFTNKVAYVGVDSFDTKRINGFNPPRRFRPDNAYHLYESIQDFLKNHLRYFDLSKTYFVMSAVPDFKATAAAFDAVENAVISYPGMKVKTKGIFADEICAAITEMRSGRLKKEMMNGEHSKKAS